MPRTPHSYRRASWHGTLPLDPDEGVVGVSMRWAQGVERFAVDRPSAVRLLASLAEALGYELRSPAGVGAASVTGAGCAPATDRRIEPREPAQPLEARDAA